MSPSRVSDRNRVAALAGPAASPMGVHRVNRFTKMYLIYVMLLYGAAMIKMVGDGFAAVGRVRA